MKYKKAPKRSSMVFVLSIAISNFFLLLPSKLNANNPKAGVNNNPTIILQNIKEFYNQRLLTLAKATNRLEYLDCRGTYQLEQVAKDDCNTSASKEILINDSSSSMVQSTTPTADDQQSEVLLDEYEKIKNFYAYDPIRQTWVKIKSFKIIDKCHNKKPIDLSHIGKLYANFWAYDVVNQTWHKVSLIPYLQQTNTQITNNSPDISTKESPLSDQNNLSDLPTDELLEELLGVHTLTKPINLKKKESVWTWANLSFDFNMGAGSVFYKNRLEEMHLLQKKTNEYLFRTKADEIYKPNWFHDTLNKIVHFDLSDPKIKESSVENVTFKGAGSAIPITLGIQYTFWKQLFMGVGKEIVFSATKKLVHNDDDMDSNEYILDKKWSTQARWFAKCGWYPFTNQKHRFFTDIRLFHVHHLDKGATSLSTLLNLGLYLHQALAYNFGLGYEQQLTNYLSCTARASIEIQYFKQFYKNEYNIDKHNLYNIHYKQTAIYMQLGLAIRFSKHDLSNDLKSKDYQIKKRKSNGISKLEGLEDCLDLD